MLKLCCIFLLIFLIYMLILTIKTGIEYRQMKKELKQKQERLTRQIEEDNKLYRENLLSMIEKYKIKPKRKFIIEK